MIASLTVIVCILAAYDERYTTNTVQKATAISRINNHTDYQVYTLTTYLGNEIDPEDTSELVQRLEEEDVYLITGKFAPTQDNRLLLTVTTSLHLDIDKDNIPISKPLAHLVGSVLKPYETAEIGFTLAIQVKPFLSQKQNDVFTIILTHPPNGRLKNAFIHAKKQSTVSTTGTLFFANSHLYCEVLEFSFITVKADTASTITVPWKSNQNDTASTSTIDKRIKNISENASKEPPAAVVWKRSFWDSYQKAIQA